MLLVNEPDQQLKIMGIDGPLHFESTASLNASDYNDNHCENVNRLDKTV